MNLQIIPAGLNRGDDSQLEKRQYLPFVLKSQCPECGVGDETDLRDSYLSYPHVGRPEEVVFSCPNQHEWTESVVIGFTLEPSP